MAEMQIKAVILLALLAGSHASRLEVTALQSARAREWELGPREEAKLAEANAVCSKVSKVGAKCQGEGCAFRPLPFDTPSKTCRLTDQHVLTGSTETLDKHIAIRADVLQSTSVAFKDGCSSNTPGKVKMSPSCSRQIGLMTQSASFLLKAEQQDAKAVASQKSKADAAFGNIASAYGPDGEYIMMLLDKVKGDTAGMVKDPEAKSKQISKLMTQLFTGTESQKAAARAEITNMPSGTGAAPSAKDLENLAKKKAMLEKKYSKKKADKTLKKVDAAIVRGASRGKDSGSSLLQRSDQVSEILGLVAAVVLTCLMTVAFIVCMVLFAIGVCALWAIMLVTGILLISLSPLLLFLCPLFWPILLLR